MNKFIIKFLFIIIFIFSFFSLDIVDAHPWRTASDWCHYCRTNCDYRWVAWNQRHCHWWSSSFSTDTYTNTYSTFSCSQYWTMAYESSTGKCSCYSWYTWWKLLWNDYCVSYSSYCSDNYWYNSKWSYTEESCVCKDWYYFKDWSCLSFTEYCTDKFWYFSYYDSFNDKCECNYWYTFVEDNFSNYSCEKITAENSCIDSVNWYLWTDNNCYCNTWYEWSDSSNKCVKSFDWIKECQSIYWINSTSDNIINNDWTYNCSCKTWYVWNWESTACISNIENKLQKQVENVFLNLKIRYSNYSIDKREALYNKLLIKLYELKDSSTWNKLIIINHLIYLINDELDIECDEVSNLLWICN